MICDQKLKLFCLNNPDLKQTILSFYFGEPNSKNALIYNILYSKKTFSSLSQNFQNIHKTQWLCYLILNVYPMYFQYVPKHIRTYPMSLKAILSFPENIKYVTYENKLLDSLLKDLIDTQKSIINYIPSSIISYDIWILIINQELFDQQVLEILEEFSPSADVRGTTDFSLNRLTLQILRPMIAWLSDHPTINICVKGNSFSFNGFYRTCKNIYAHELISERKLNMSISEED